MTERWTLRPSEDGQNAPASVETLRSRIAEGRFETWFLGPSERSLAFVTNRERAMVLLLERDDDPGEHAVSPEAGPDLSGGFRLANGQEDEYPDADTVPIAEGLRIVDHVLRTGGWPDDAPWVSDR